MTALELNRSERRFRTAMLGWYRRHPRTFPWRRRRDPYSVLIGEIMLQRTRGEHVADVYREFLRRWPNPRSLASARESSIASVIRPLGLAKRASILKRLGTALSKEGRVPVEPAQLEQMPGVGPYAAHAVPAFALGRNLPVIDWVIARVVRRYFGLPHEKRPNADRELWSFASHLACRGRARELWLGTLDFAAAVCKPQPLCEICSLRRDCRYYSDASRAGRGSASRNVRTNEETGRRTLAD